MNITYVILRKKEEKISDKTIKSVSTNVNNNDFIAYVELDTNADETQNYPKIFEKFNKESWYLNSDYIVLIPNNSFLEENFRVIVEEYVSDNKTVYLPFSLLIAENNTKGLLNTSMWTNHAVEVGILDHELALMQADTVLYGAIIPKDILLNESFYSEEIKYFQHFYFVNSITNEQEITVRGIPKLLLNLDYDLTFNHVSKEEKSLNYKLAREKFINALAVNG